ncbi:hypothetical protein J6590_068632 [Homalodisca vitripennis]|nr:hypothetical protein J6590_068632 [Homalodisca vitripennis]
MKKNKKNSRKENRANTIDTSSSEDDLMNFLSDVEEDDMTMEELIQSVWEEEMDIALQDKIECVEIKQDDYVLVKLAGKKKVLYYVAKVITKVDVVYEIQYLMKTENNTFILRNETIYEIDEEEVICKLPTPSTTGSSERLKQSLKFPVNFSAYDMPMD